MTPWKRKYRRAKRNPLRLLSKQSHRLYGKGYLAFLEEKELITRNTFYDKVRRRTLPNATAATISKLLEVSSGQWYAGEKSTGSPDKEINLENDIDFSELDELLP